VSAVPDADVALILRAVADEIDSNE